jgi:hypothetical protein
MRWARKPAVRQPRAAGRLGVQWLPELGFTDETTILISGRYLEYSLPWGVSVVLGNIPAWPGA